jgi:hypothetical protein
MAKRQNSKGKWTARRASAHKDEAKSKDQKSNKGQTWLLIAEG